MADDVMGKAADAGAAPAAATGAPLPTRQETRADRARRVAYRNRFGLLYFLLAIVAGAGIGAFLVLVQQGGPQAAPAWSDWAPTGSAERREAQIAQHVSSTYRLPSGTQLAAVTYSGPPTVTGPDGSTFQVRAIAVRPDTTGGQAATGDVETVDAASTVMYTLCGLGPSCSIAEGKPTVARHQLLRREALELALYSFTYLDGVDSVLVLLPPRSDGQAATSVFLRRSDVAPQLAQPLVDTLPSATTPTVGQIPSEERRVIDATTLSRLYSYSYLQAQDGSPVMVLTPALNG
ncbi:MAG: hypothetical protein ACM3QU_01505 [Verrucomicrobiota bacterium]